MALNNDGDIRTACVRGSDLSLRPDEVGNPNGVHFSAQALRDIGRRYADSTWRLIERWVTRSFVTKAPDRYSNDSVCLKDLRKAERRGGCVEFGQGYCRHAWRRYHTVR